MTRPRKKILGLSVLSVVSGIIGIGFIVSAIKDTK